MMKALEEFTVDSNGRCLICLVKPKSDGRNLSQSGSHSVSSLRALSHYLNLDLGKLFRDHSKGNHQYQLLQNFGLKATLCEECVSIHQDLLKLYLQLVQVEIEMGSWLKLIRWKLSEGDDAGRGEFDCKRRLNRGLGQGKDLETVEELRRETLQKCCLKLCSFQPAASDEAMTEDKPRAPMSQPIRSNPGGLAIHKYKSNYFDQCLICLLKLNTECMDPSSSSLATRLLKALTQYLKISLDLNITPVELKLSMCQECVSIHQEFLKLYQQLVKIEMEMGTWLKLLRWKLSEVDGAAQAELKSSGGWNGRDKLKLVEELRNEVLDKCSLILSSFPVAAIEDITSETTQDNQSSSPPNATAPKLNNSHRITKQTTPLKCGVCEKEFYHRSSLAAHRLTHFEAATSPIDKPDDKITAIKTELNRKSILSCRHCKLGFHQRALFIKHFSRVHLQPSCSLDTATGNLKCDLCQFVFSDNELIREHLSFHVTLRKKCEECEGEFENDTLLQQHRQRVHQDILEFQCPNCEQIMPSPATYKRHMEKCTEGAILSCRLCKKEFKRYTQFRFHWNRIHETVAELECDLCPKKFKLPGDLANHRMSHQYSREFECDLCNRKFKHPVHLQTHQEHIHAQVPLPNKLQCDLCPKKFKLLDSLNMHRQAVHQQSPKPGLENEQLLKFECPECSNLFIDRESMLEHRLTHFNKKPDTRPSSKKRKLSDFKTWVICSCRRCKLAFSSHEIFTTHVNLFHRQPRSSISRETGNHKCDLCQKEFMNASSFQGHLPEHLKLKRKCLECNHVAEDEYSLIQHHKEIHMKFHDSSMEWNVVTCRKCRISFKLVSAFRDHWNIKHPQMPTFICKHETKSPLPEPNEKISNGDNDTLSMKCPNCELKFNDRLSMLEHRMSHFEKNVVSRQSSNKRAAILRMKRKLILSCRKCKLAFNTLESFTTHLKRAHLEPVTSINPKTGMYTCSLCSAEFKELAGFRDHISVHLKLRDKCVMCGIKMAGPLSLHRHHQLVHMGFTECIRCGQVFEEEALYKEHASTNGCRFVSCRLCRKEFTSATKFGKHWKNGHIYNCTHCQMKFTTADELTLHSNEIHPGTRQFKCDLCHHSFSESRYLTWHQAVVHRAGMTVQPGSGHLGVGAFPQFGILQSKKDAVRTAQKCPECGMEFIQKAQFCQHYATHFQQK